MIAQYISSLILLTSLVACNTVDSPPDKAVLNLTLEDASCTEAWMTLTTIDLTLPAELALKQYNQTGDAIRINLILNTQDILLYIDSLFPNRTYNFHSFIQSFNQSSNELSVTTIVVTAVSNERYETKKVSEQFYAFQLYYYPAGFT